MRFDLGLGGAVPNLTVSFTIGGPDGRVAVAQTAPTTQAEHNATEVSGRGDFGGRSGDEGIVPCTSPLPQ